MGFFSWKMIDVDISIANRHSIRNTVTAFMHDNKGNKWQEDNYEGYGEFGGKDFYELVAEMNGLSSDRDVGIFIHEHIKEPIYPQLTFHPELPEDVDFHKEPEQCEYQGCFYDY